VGVAAGAVGNVAGELGKGLMSGVNGVFDKLGVTAGFQAVFGADIDKSDEGLAKKFVEVDADGSGKISTEEMRNAIVAMYGEKLPEDTLEKMMKAADTDGDGEVDLEEFKVIMRAGPDKK